MTKQTFTASNGVTVTISHDGYLLATADGMCHATGGADLGAQALREYFTHERDKELGRWRDPEAPDVVVYHLPSAKREATGRTVRVLDERLGAVAICNEHLERSSDPTNAEPSAARYFAAHPEPREWHDAQPGEVWLLDIDGAEEPATVGHSPTPGVRKFYDGSDMFDLTDPGITAGRRLYPERSDDGR